MFKMNAKDCALLRLCIRKIFRWPMMSIVVAAFIAVTKGLLNSYTYGDVHISCVSTSTRKSFSTGGTYPVVEEGKLERLTQAQHGHRSFWLLSIYHYQVIVPSIIIIVIEPSLLVLLFCSVRSSYLRLEGIALFLRYNTSILIKCRL